MKKILPIIYLVLVCVPWLCGMPLPIGAVYKVCNDKCIPVFNVPCTNMEYESGLRGNNCYNLVTVLLPASYIEIVSDCGDGIYQVACKLTDEYQIDGFVHRAFLEKNAQLLHDVCMSDICASRNVPCVQNIVKEIYRLYKNNVPYCHGCNLSGEIDLSETYTFVQSTNTNGRERKFVCCGFDSAGLLHYLSNGYLPHDIEQLINCGKKLFIIDGQRKVTKAMIKSIMCELQDTDFIVFETKCETESEVTGHVLIAYRFGFVECRGKNFGMAVVPSYDVEARLLQLMSKARASNAVVYVIRWHPALLGMN